MSQEGLRCITSWHRAGLASVNVTNTHETFAAEDVDATAAKAQARRVPIGKMTTRKHRGSQAALFAGIAKAFRCQVFEPTAFVGTSACGECVTSVLVIDYDCYVFWEF